ncbi:MAG: hypothetical protein ACTS6J_22795 [Burkholderiales bacterium]
MIPTRRAAPVAALLFLALASPPLRHALEASMTAQMLVQLPLLAGVGYLLGLALPVRVAASLVAWNHRGITGLVLASLASAYWMLPRLLDASATEPATAAIKFVSVPLLVGLALAQSWPRSSFVVRGVFLIELIATLFRLGWLYLVSPVRLCNNYLLDDQQRLGQILIAVGAMLFLWIAWKLLWGRFDLTRYAGEWTDGRPPSPIFRGDPE